MLQKPSKRIRVVILINELLRGGAQRIVLDIARSLDATRFDLEVVYLKAEANFPEDSQSVKAELEAAGISLVCLQGGPVFKLSDAWHLYQYLRRSKPDILQTFLPYAGILGRTVGPLAGVRRVTSVQCNLPVAYDRKTFWLDKLTLPLATSWTGATEGIEQSYGGSNQPLTKELWNAGRRHFTIVAGVDLPIFDARLARAHRAEKRNEIEVPTDAMVVMMIARLISWKGHEDLIGALKLLPPHVHLVLVGWGPLEAELKEQAANEGLLERIHFLGPRSDVIELLSIADVYVQAHSRAPDGNIWMGPNTSQMEACAAGVPSVSTAVPLIETLIEEGKTGRLARPNDPHDLARAIQEVLSDPEGSKEMKLHARTRVEERYSVAAMVRNYEMLYEFLVQR